MQRFLHVLNTEIYIVESDSNLLMSNKYKILAFSAVLVTMVTSVVIISSSPGTAFAQAKPKSIIFWSIIFSGVNNGKPSMNITKLAFNGTDVAMRQQIPSAVEKVYAIASKLTVGPSVTLGASLNKTSVSLSLPTKEDLTRYIESALNKPANAPADDECWMFWVGGGSMHGDCPKQQ